MSEQPDHVSQVLLEKGIKYQKKDARADESKWENVIMLICQRKWSLQI